MRPQPSAAAADALSGDGASAAVLTAPRQAPTTTGASPARSSVSARRTPGAVRKAPGIAINYAYLRRDLFTLAVLAPSMVVLLVVAFLVLQK
jgi:hypothetical protein